MDHATSDNEIFLLFLNLDMVLRNSNSKRQGRRQPIIKTSWPGPTNFWFDHSTAFNKSCVVGVS